MYTSGGIITILYIRNADNLLGLPFAMMVAPFFGLRLRAWSCQNRKHFDARE
jgi:hypothetical protein